MKLLPADGVWSVFNELNVWIMGVVRGIQWEQWNKPCPEARVLRSRGIFHEEAVRLQPRPRIRPR
jgi:hypothetical protein